MEKFRTMGKNEVILVKSYTILLYKKVYENNLTHNNKKNTITYSKFYNLTISGLLTRWPCAQSSEHV